MKKEIRWLLKEKYFNKSDKNFYKDVERLTADEPLDYVIGFTEFLGCKIDLSKKPLIPRPETEFWVKEAIKNISYDFQRFENRKIKVLDLFTGSGCIGLAVLKNIKDSSVTFADKDKKCLEQIKLNLKINGLIRTSKRTFIVRQSDVFSNIRNKYDFIFANPPYIKDYRKNPSASLRAILRNRIHKSVLKYEPKKALFGGKDGLRFIRKFLKEAVNHLNKDGKVFMEFSPEQKNKIEKILKTLRHGSGRFREIEYSNYEFHKDQFGKWRWASIDKG
jgi:release factor glutamine methyltransferase